MLTKIAIGLAAAYIGSEVAISVLQETAKAKPRAIPRPVNWTVTEPSDGSAEV